jgi:hypothetical protein
MSDVHTITMPPPLRTAGGSADISSHMPDIYQRAQIKTTFNRHMA